MARVKGAAMISEAYRYKFGSIMYLPNAEGTLHVALIAAEGLFGEARVRMDAGYAVDEVLRVFVVDASTEVGQAVTGMFTSLLLREFGPEAFHVRRVEGRPGCTCQEEGR